jgi:TonB family protein
MKKLLMASAMLVAFAGAAKADDKPWEQLASRWVYCNAYYPHAAYDRGETGSPVVAFRVDTKGHAHNVSIRTSSGYPELDASAIASVLGANPFPIPEKAINVTLKLNFKADAKAGWKDGIEGSPCNRQLDVPTS